ncbi:MAG: hypothetical protein ACRBBM_18265 [Pseudomonadaceae bacterium]
MEAAVWGFIGTLVGALASLGGTWLTNHNARTLHAEALKLERDEKARAFQRDTLIALQDAVHDLLRLIARGHHEDILAFRETGKWGKTLLTNEVSDGQMLARRHMLILLERVLNDALRTQVKDLNAKLTEISFAVNETDAHRLWDSASIHGLEVLEHIGKALRAQY